MQRTYSSYTMFINYFNKDKITYGSGSQSKKIMPVCEKY